MDSLTHLVAGALAPVAFRGAPKRAALIAFGIAAGEFPDLDILFGSGAEALLTLHRGISHSLFWQPAMALIVTIPFFILMRCRGPCCPADAPGARPGPEFGFGRMLLAALIALCTHIYLDCMTTFGTMALLPFSPVRVGFPALFIVDFALTVPILALLVLALREPGVGPPVFGRGGGLRSGGSASPGGACFFSDRARRFALAGLAWVFVYPLLAFGVNQAATARLAPVFAPEGLVFAEDEAPRFNCGRFFLLTEPFSPFVWKGVIDQGDFWRMDVLDLRALFAAPRTVGDGVPLFGTVYAKPEPALYESLKRQLPLFVWFEDFAPYMTQTERPVSSLVQAGYRETIREYAFMALRYIMPGRSFAHRVGQGEPHFVLEARVTEAGALAEYRFLESGRDADQPWAVRE